MSANSVSPAPAPLVARTQAIPDPGDLLSYLPTSDASGILAWVRRGKGLIGIGETLRITTSGRGRFAEADSAFAEIAARAIIRDDVNRPGTGPLAFGSFAFSGDSPAGGVLIVPKVILGKDDEGAWLTTISAGGLTPLPAPADLLRGVEAELPEVSVEFSPGSLGRAEWLRQVEQVTGRIRAGEAGKVVLARDAFANLSGPGDARRVLRGLSEEYSSCWAFAVDGFFGATPELLARRQRGLISSRVLAGTIQRSGDGDVDASRAAALARDSKELSEHAYAVDSLVDSLRPFAASFSVPDAPFILHLPNVMHLATDVTAVPTAEAAGASSLALAARFHPTAAVCGTPTPVAAEILHEHENFDRHRYAGPVGWVGADGDGEWGIALRSGRAISASQWQIFAGCGIMADSRPEAEWAETEAKFAPMRSALARA